MRVCRKVSVFRAMPGILPLELSLWIGLLAVSDAMKMPGITELPRGNDRAVRAWADASSERAPDPPPRAASAPRHTRSFLPRISSGFGRRSDPIEGDRRWHYGIDLPGARGTPVMASETGIVRFAGAAGGYGRMVEIAHGRGFSTRYAHLDCILVAVGTRVARGEPIALMGASGRATGSHLHFELREDGKAVNPLPRLGTFVPHEKDARHESSSRHHSFGRAENRVNTEARTAEVHLSAFARARAAANQGKPGSEP